MPMSGQPSPHGVMEAAVNNSRQGYEGENPGSALLLAEGERLDRYLRAITMLHNMVGV